MYYTKTITLGGLLLLVSAPITGLPIDLIHRQGEYLKGLITQANLEQFKRDTAIFFEFDPQFPPSGQQMVEYKKVAKALLDHANLMRAEKFEERKLLLGKTVHNRKALVKSILLGVTTAVGVAGSGTALFIGFFGTLDRIHVVPIAIGLLGLGLTGLCAYGTRSYYRLGLNSIDTINLQTRELWNIVEHAKRINMQLNPSEEPRA